MGSCPSCGASSFFGVNTKQCAWCGKIVCNKCLPNWHGSIAYKIQVEEATGRPATYDSAGFCSNFCFNQFWQKVQEYPMDEVGTDSPVFAVRVTWLWNQAILNAAAKANPTVARYLVPRFDFAIRISSPRFVAFPWLDPTGKPVWMFERFYAQAKLALAKNLERCGRTQDAAKVFEEMRMYDKARELREKDRHIIVKNTNVSVNLNALLQQVKDGGVVAVFRCPFCGGNLKINKDTTLDSLKICEHCHSEITSMDLADFLNAVLR